MRIDVRTHIHISFNYYPASDDWGTGTYTFTRDDFCCLLITVWTQVKPAKESGLIWIQTVCYSYSKHQTRFEQNVGPYLDPNYLTLWWYKGFHLGKITADTYLEAMYSVYIASSTYQSF